MEDMPWNISKAVEGYYYTYFEYPHNIEDIECYLWSVINNILTCYVIELSMNVKLQIPNIKTL